MRTDKISIQESRDIILRYFASGFELGEVMAQFQETRSKKAILQSLKQTIKQYLLEMQGQLFVAKQIDTLRIYDNINITPIMTQIHNLSQILTTPQTAHDFLTYYRYKSQFVIMTRFQVIEIPVDPITSKKKLAVYECFIEYFQNGGLFQVGFSWYLGEGDGNGQGEGNGARDGGREGGYVGGQGQPASLENNPLQLYTIEQIYKIFQYYQEYSGNLQKISHRLQLLKQPLPVSQNPNCPTRIPHPQKYKKSNLKILLINYLTIGLGRVYKISNNLDKFLGCSWQKFQTMHHKIMKNFTYDQKRLVIRLGIYNTMGEKDIVSICERIGVRYRPVGYPKWLKDNSHVNLYRKEKMSVMERIRSQMRSIIEGEDAGEGGEGGMVGQGANCQFMG